MFNARLDSRHLATDAFPVLQDNIRLIKAVYAAIAQPEHFHYLGVVFVFHALQDNIQTLLPQLVLIALLELFPLHLNQALALVALLGIIVHRTVQCLARLVRLAIIHHQGAVRVFLVQQGNIPMRLLQLVLIALLELIHLQIQVLAQDVLRDLIALKMALHLAHLVRLAIIYCLGAVRVFLAPQDNIQMPLLQLAPIALLDLTPLHLILAFALVALQGHTARKVALRLAHLVRLVIILPQE
jgi:hypothetical protein